jgi:predicted DNA-binding protein (UPF0251 family)
MRRLVPDSIVWEALDLITNDGLTQADAARLLGISTRTLIRKLTLLRKVAKENAIQIGWESI